MDKLQLKATKNTKLTEGQISAQFNYFRLHFIIAPGGK